MTTHTETELEPHALPFELEGVIADLQAGLIQPNKVDIATLRNVQKAITALLKDKGELETSHIALYRAAEASAHYMASLVQEGFTIPALGVVCDAIKGARARLNKKGTDE